MMKPFVALTDLGMEGLTMPPTEVFVRISHIQKIAFHKPIQSGKAHPAQAVVFLMDHDSVRVQDPKQIALLRDIALNQY